MRKVDDVCLVKIKLYSKLKKSSKTGLDYYHIANTQNVNSILPIEHSTQTTNATGKGM